MKLYYSPGACSLADHIALHEAGLSFDCEKVDLKTKRTQGGADFLTVNPKGYVPALTIDSKETLTENVAILDWIAQQNETLRPSGPLGRTRLLEALSYISTEIHKAFKPFFGGTDEQKAAAGKMLFSRMSYLTNTFQGSFLFGDHLSVADCYLLVMLLWARKNGLDVPSKLVAFRDAMLERPAVKAALKHEGLA